MNTKILDKRVKDRDTEGVKGGLKSIISGLTNAQRSLKLESVELPTTALPSTVKSKLMIAIDTIKDAQLNYNQKVQVVKQVTDSLGIDKSEFNKIASRLKGTMESVNEVSYNVKADNAYQFINGATAVLGAYLRDEKLESGVKNTLQRVVKDLEGLKKYFFSRKDESVNEGKTYSNKFAAWFTGTVLNSVKHPTYGKHQLTADQIANAPADYKNKLFKAIELAVKNGDITPDNIRKNESLRLTKIK
jgi:hypothetical protein